MRLVGFDMKVVIKDNTEKVRLEGSIVFDLKKNRFYIFKISAMYIYISLALLCFALLS